MIFLFMFLAFAYLAVCGVIFNIRWMSGIGSKSQSDLRQELLRLKNRGIQTIDQALDEFGYKPKAAAPTNVPIPKQAEKTTHNQPKADNRPAKAAESEQPESIVAVKNNQAEPTRDSRPALDSAGVMLYLGAALVIFAVLIFVAFNWQNFDNLLKSLLLGLVTAAFYAAELWTHRTERFRPAGIVFSVIASSALALSGIGWWNFGARDLTGLDFMEYWTGFSVLMAAIFWLTARRLQLKSFWYAPLAAVYSFLVAASFSLTTDFKFRIVVLAAFNLILFLAYKLMGPLKASSQMASRVVNWVLNFLILLIVTVNLQDIRTQGLQAVTLIALLVPTLFNFCAYLIFGRRNNPETFAELILIPLKLILACAAFRTDTYTGLVVLTMYGLILILSRQTEFLSRAKVLKNLCTFLVWVISTSVVLLSFGAFVAGNYQSIISAAQVIILLLTNSLILLAFTMARRSIPEMAISLVYPLTLIPMLVDYINLNLNPASSIVFVISYLFGLGAVIALHQTSALREFRWVPLPATIASGLSTLGFAYAVTNNPFPNAYSLIMTGIVALTLLAVSRISKFAGWQFGALPLSLAVFLIGIDTLEQLQVFNPSPALHAWLALVPVAIAALSIEFEKQPILRSTNTVLVFLLGLLSMQIAVPAAGSLVWISLLLLAYGIFCMLRHRTQPWLTYPIALQSILALFALASYFRWPVEITNLGANALGLAFFGLSLSTLKPWLTDTQTRMWRIIACFFAGILLIYLIPGAFMQPGNAYILSCLVWFLALLTGGLEIRILQYFSGLSLVLAAWSMAGRTDFQWQFYSLPLLAYLLVCAYLLRLREKKQASLVLEGGAYTMEMLVLLGQSLPRDSAGIAYGLLLILVSSVLAVWGTLRKFRYLQVVSLVALGLCLIVRLYVVLLAIPWYIYVFLIGLGLIAAAILTLARFNKPHGRPNEK